MIVSQLRPAVTAHLASRLEAYLNDLATLVSQDSYSFDKDDVNQIVGWLETHLLALGFEVERFAYERGGDDLLARRRGTGQGRILLLGHSDTVFPHGTAAARPMSFAGDKILGPGTCDMKGGLLAGIYAAEALNAVGFDDYEQLAFLIVSDEEVDGRHSVPLIRRACREADVVLTLECARENGDIVTARKGVRAFIGEAFGKSAHSGVEPEKGRHAVLAMARQVIDLQALNDPARDISVNVGFIEGGRLRNIVPDYARIHFEARAFTRADLDEVTQAVVRLFEREVVPDVRLKVEYGEASPPMPRTPAIARLEAMAQDVARELGFEVNGAKTGGTGDVCIVAEEGIPALDGLGPIGGLDHGPDEYILKSSIVPRTALLALLIAEIAAQSGAA